MCTLNTVFESCTELVEGEESVVYEWRTLKEAIMSLPPDDNLAGIENKLKAMVQQLGQKVWDCL